MDINLIKKNTELPDLTPLNWDVEINGHPYYVVHVNGFVHSIGGKYGENDLWAYPREQVPSYENLIEFDCDNPVSWGINYIPKNYSKCKWDECTASSGGQIIITRNGKPFDNNVGKGINYGIDKARVMITEFQEHPLDLCTIGFDAKMIGRKVWWRSEPAIITRYVSGQACVILTPDGIDKFTVPAEFKDEEGSDYYEYGEVNAHILDKNIWWFRG